MWRVQKLLNGKTLHRRCNLYSWWHKYNSRVDIAVNTRTQINNISCQKWKNTNYKKWNVTCKFTIILLRPVNAAGNCTDKYRLLLSHSFIFFMFYFLITVYMVSFLFDNVIYVFLLLWLCILIVCLCMTTLTEVFPCFSSVVRQMPG